jgi:Domain of unknown function (DUF4956)
MEEFIRQLETGAGAPSVVPLEAALITLLVATLIGTFLSYVYSVTYTGKKEERTQIAFTIILLAMGGALVWLLVADNLVRAFGLAGALSLIRYRTNVNDPKDTSLMFFAMLFGMACGVHQYVTAVSGVLFLTVVMVIMKFVSDNLKRGSPGPNGKHSAAPAAVKEDEPAPDAPVEDDV